MAYANSKMIAV